MATETAITNAWTQVAADISALTVLQLVSSGTVECEITAATATPATSDIGYRMLTGDTLTSGAIADIGSSGALYARMKRGYGKIISG